MVELDELKSMWQKSAPVFTHEDINQQELAVMIRQRSISIIERMKRNVFSEIIIACFCMLLIGYIPFIYRNATISIITAVVLLFIFVPYLIYYTRKYGELKHFSSYQENMKDSLSKLIIQIEHNLRIYFWGSLFLTPVTVFLSGVVLLHELKAIGVLLYFDVFNIATLSLLLFAALLATLLSYPLLKWYIRKLYGKPVERLKINLKELQQVSVLLIFQMIIAVSLLCTNLKSSESVYTNQHSVTTKETWFPDSCSHNTFVSKPIYQIQKWILNRW